jgi:chromosome segregation ATPase
VLRNLKAENQRFRVKNRNLRLNLQALHRKLGFIEESDKKKAQELSALKKKISNLKKERDKLKKRVEK